MSVSPPCQSSSPSFLKFFCSARLWLGAGILVAGSIQCTGPLVVEPMQSFDTCEDLNGFLTERILHPRATGSEGSAVLTGCAAEAELMSVGAGAAEPEATFDPPADYTTTNVQVQEVDEADIVKTNGEVLYVLKGNMLHVVDTWPAENASLLNEIDLETRAARMFLDDDLLVVIGADSYARDGDRFRDGGLVEVRWFDVSEPADPVLTRRLAVDGVYTDARRVDDELMLVTTRSLLNDAFMNRQLFSDDENRARLEESPIEDRFPILRELNVDDGSTVSARALSSCDKTIAPDRTDGTSLTNVTRIHLRDDAQPVHSTAVVTPWAEMYATSQSVYLAAIEMSDGGPFTPNMYTTRVHKLRAFDGDNAATYAGTAVLDGQLLSRYSMDEHDGHLRMVLSKDETIREGSSPENFLVVLGDTGMGLDEVGRVEDIGDGEYVQAVRFKGERGYVVTYPVNNGGVPPSSFTIPRFNVFDPLFVLDLSNPEAPAKRGELHVGGYSTYIHPLDDDHLLTIGVNTSEQNQYRGMIMTIFDVSDPDMPTEKHRTPFGDAASSSLALSNPYAFTYFASQQLLAVPMSRNPTVEAFEDPWFDDPNFAEPDPAAPNDRGDPTLDVPDIADPNFADANDDDEDALSGLRVFDIDTDTGIHDLGTLVSPFDLVITEDMWGWQRVRCGGIERSTMASTEDGTVYLYGVAPGGVQVGVVHRDDDGEPLPVSAMHAIDFAGDGCFE